MTDALLRKAENLFRNGRKQAAIDLLEEYLAEKPRDIAAAAVLGRIYLNAGHPQRATHWLRRAQKTRVGAISGSVYERSETTWLAGEADVALFNDGEDCGDERDWMDDDPLAYAPNPDAPTISTSLDLCEREEHSTDDFWADEGKEDLDVKDEPDMDCDLLVFGDRIGGHSHLNEEAVVESMPVQNIKTQRELQDADGNLVLASGPIEPCQDDSQEVSSENVGEGMLEQFTSSEAGGHVSAPDHSDSSLAIADPLFEEDDGLEEAEEFQAFVFVDLDEDDEPEISEIAPDPAGLTIFEKATSEAAEIAAQADWSHTELALLVEILALNRCHYKTKKALQELIYAYQATHDELRLAHEVRQSWRLGYFTRIFRAPPWGGGSETLPWRVCLSIVRELRTQDFEEVAFFIEGCLEVWECSRKLMRMHGQFKSFLAHVVMHLEAEGDSMIYGAPEAVKSNLLMSDGEGLSTDPLDLVLLFENDLI